MKCVKTHHNHFYLQWSDYPVIFDVHVNITVKCFSFSAALFAWKKKSLTLVQENIPPMRFWLVWFLCLYTSSWWKMIYSDGGVTENKKQSAQWSSWTKLKHVGISGGEDRQTDRLRLGQIQGMLRTGNWSPRARECGRHKAGAAGETVWRTWNPRNERERDEEGRRCT